MNLNWSGCKVQDHRRQGRPLPFLHKGMKMRHDASSPFGCELENKRGSIIP